MGETTKHRSPQFQLGLLLSEAGRAAESLTAQQRQLIASAAIIDVADYLRSVPVNPLTGKRSVPASVVRSVLQVLCDLGEFVAAVRAFKSGFLSTSTHSAAGANSASHDAAELGAGGVLGGSESGSSGGLSAANLSDATVKAHLAEQLPLSLAPRLFVGCEVAAPAGSSVAASELRRTAARVAATLRVGSALIESLGTITAAANAAGNDAGDELAAASAAVDQAAGAAGSADAATGDAAAAGQTADANAASPAVDAAASSSSPAGSRPPPRVSPAAVHVSEATALFKRCTRFAEAALGMQVIPDGAAGTSATAATAAAAPSAAGSASSSSREHSAAAAADAAAAAALVAPAREHLVHALLRVYSRLGLPSAAAAADLGYRPSARLVASPAVAAPALSAAAVAPGASVSSSSGSTASTAAGSLYLSVFPPPSRWRKAGGGTGSVVGTGSGHLTEAVTLARARLGDLAAAMAIEQSRLAAAKEAAAARARRLERTARLKAREADEATEAASFADAGGGNFAGADAEAAGGSDVALAGAGAGGGRGKPAPPRGRSAPPEVLRDPATAAIQAAARAAEAARAAALTAAKAARAAGRAEHDLDVASAASAAPAQPPMHPGAFLWARRGGLWTPRRNNALLRLLEAGVWRPVAPGMGGAVGLPGPGAAAAGGGGAAGEGEEEDGDVLEAMMREAAASVEPLPPWMRPRLRKARVGGRGRLGGGGRTASASAGQSGGAASLRKRSRSSSNVDLSAFGYGAAKRAASSAESDAMPAAAPADDAPPAPQRSSSASAAGKKSAGTGAAATGGLAGGAPARSFSTSAFPSAAAAAAAGAGAAAASARGAAAAPRSQLKPAAKATAGARRSPARATAARSTAPPRPPVPASAPLPSGYDDVDFAALDLELASSVAATGTPMALASALGLGASIGAQAAEIAASAAAAAAASAAAASSAAAVAAEPSAAAALAATFRQPAAQPRRARAPATAASDASHQPQHQHHHQPQHQLLGEEEYEAFHLTPFRAPFPKGYALTDAAVEPTRAAYRMARYARSLPKQRASKQQQQQQQRKHAAATAAGDAASPGASDAFAGPSGPHFTVFPASYHPAVDTVLTAAPISTNGRAGAGDGARPITDCHSPALPLLAGLWREASGRVIARDGIGLLAVPGGLHGLHAASSSAAGGAAAAPPALAWAPLIDPTATAASFTSGSASTSGAGERVRLLLALAANRADVAAILRMAAADGVAVRGASLLTAATQLVRFGDVAGAHAALQTSAAQLNAALQRRAACVAREQQRRAAAGAATAASSAAAPSAGPAGSTSGPRIDVNAPIAGGTSASAVELVARMGRLTDPLPLAVELFPPTLPAPASASASASAAPSAAADVAAAGAAASAASGPLLPLTADEVSWVASIRDAYDGVARALAADGAHILALTAARARAACFRRLHELTDSAAVATSTATSTSAPAPASSAGETLPSASQQASALRHAMGWHPTTLRSLLRAALRSRLTLDARSLLHFLRAAAWSGKSGREGSAVASAKGGGGMPVDCGPAGPLWNAAARWLWHHGKTSLGGLDHLELEAAAVAAEAAASGKQPPAERLRIRDTPHGAASAAAAAAATKPGAPTASEQQLRQMSHDLAELQRAVDALPLPVSTAASAPSPASSAASGPPSRFVFPTARLIAEVDAAARLPPSTLKGAAPSPAAAVHRVLIERILPMYAAAAGAHAAPLMAVLPANAADAAGLKPSDFAADTSQQQAQPQPLRMPASLARTVVASYARAGAPIAAAAAARLMLTLGARLSRASDFLPILDAAGSRDDVSEAAFPALRLMMDCGALLPRRSSSGAAQARLRLSRASAVDDAEADLDADGDAAASSAAVVAALLRLSARVAEADNSPVPLHSLRRAAASAAPAAADPADADATAAQTTIVSSSVAAAETVSPTDVAAPKPLPRSRGSSKGASVAAADAAVPAAAEEAAPPSSSVVHVVSVPALSSSSASASRLTPAQAARVASVIARHSVFADTLLGRRVRDALRGRLGLEAEGQGQASSIPQLSAGTGTGAAAGAGAPAHARVERALPPPTSPVQALLQAQAAARELVTAVINVTLQQLQAQARARADIMAAATAASASESAAASTNLDGGGISGAGSGSGSTSHASSIHRAAGAAAADIDGDGGEDWLTAAQEMLLLAIREWPGARGSDGALLPLLKDDHAASPSSAASSSLSSLESRYDDGYGGPMARSRFHRRLGRSRGSRAGAAGKDGADAASATGSSSSSPATLPLAPPAVARVNALLDAVAGGRRLPFTPHLDILDQAAGTTIGHVLALMRAPRLPPRAATLAAQVAEHGGALQHIYRDSPFGPHKYRHGLSVDEDGSGGLGRWPVFKAARSRSLRPYARSSAAETAGKRAVEEAVARAAETADAAELGAVDENTAFAADAADAAPTGIGSIGSRREFARRLRRLRRLRAVLPLRRDFSLRRDPLEAMHEELMRRAGTGSMTPEQMLNAAGAAADALDRKGGAAGAAGAAADAEEAEEDDEMELSPASSAAVEAAALTGGADSLVAGILAALGRPSSSHAPSHAGGAAAPAAAAATKASASQKAAAGAPRWDELSRLLAQTQDGLAAAARSDAPPLR